MKLIRARAPRMQTDSAMRVFQFTVVTTKTQDDNSHKIDYNITGKTHATILCEKWSNCSAVCHFVWMCGSANKRRVGWENGFQWCRMRPCALFYLDSQHLWYSWKWHTFHHSSLQYFLSSLCLALSTGHHLNASMYVNRKFEVNLKRRWLWAFDWLYGKYFNPLINNDYDPGFDV